MDFPIFHLECLNNRMLSAIIAILHVLINHLPAVGGIPLVSLLEWQGARSGDPDIVTFAKALLAIKKRAYQGTRPEWSRP
jgi:hypothetical protein